MCLFIDKSITKLPKKKYMWKVVYKDMRPPFYSKKPKYVIGKWYKSDRYLHSGLERRYNGDGNWNVVN